MTHTRGAVLLALMVAAGSTLAADGQDRGDRDALRVQQREVRRERRQAVSRAREGQRFNEMSPSDDPCRDRDRDERRGHACEVRDTRLPAPIGPLTVDAAPNGGIRVQGWDEPDVLVRAVVQTWGEDDAEATGVLGQVQVHAAGTRVSAEGPQRTSGRGERGWSVSFRIWAPRQTALALTAENGGVTIASMTGESRFSTTNGGVTLSDVGGHVAGSTRNGGVHVRLDGARWDGTGLEVETTNGGVTVAIPSGYSAELEASTLNGGFRTDYPITVQGRIDRHVRTTLGGGGALLKLTTTNGGVRITQR